MAGKLTGVAPLASRALLARILDQPDLVAAVQALPARALGKLIEHVGLEDCGEIVALATTEQLRRIFDDDLWRSERPGKDETFDADRFALWLEVMLEAGEEFAAQKLAELPEDLITLALARQVLVINIDELALTMSDGQSDEDAQLEKALESCLCEELGEFRIIARRHEAWDAILSILLALDRDHHDYLQRVLERCCYVANEAIEDNGGLYNVLTSEEMLEIDVAADREDRRAGEGFIAPSSAASFLALARTSSLSEIVKIRERDPVARAYFRTLQPLRAGKRPDGEAPRPQSAQAATNLIEVMREADVLEPAHIPKLLEARTPAGEDVFTQAMRELQQRTGGSHGKRMEELAFLANVLVAGASLDGRPFRPVEAGRAVVALCNLGLEWMIENKEGPSEPAAALELHGADRLFRVAWRLLHQEVVLPAARALETLLNRARIGASECDSDAARARATAALHAAVAAGKPWLARSKLAACDDVVAPDTLAALLALMDECPFRRDQNEVKFLSTTADLREVRAFLERL